MTVPSTPRSSPDPATDARLVNESTCSVPSIDQRASLHGYITDPANRPVYSGQEYSGWYWREMVSAWQLTYRHPDAVPAEPLLDWLLDHYLDYDTEPPEHIISRLNAKLDKLDAGLLISQPSDWECWVNVIAPFAHPWSVPAVLVVDAREWVVDSITAAMGRARDLRAEGRCGWKVEVLVSSLFQREEAEKAAAESAVDVGVVLMGPVNVWDYLAMVDGEVF